ncbi:MarR family winged helix-turn-helix transcriptional regulator [Rummeliibacillus sp. NPDC094406]|uniref:MarR family winged helix-turn-helix transcriptional regulator n=1 Tax=Rummeliibacillus sp. NPDC094406 TaxID=3364511 RepID=UPI00380D7594
MARCPKIPMQEPQEFTRGEMGILVYLQFKSDGVTSGDLSESLSVSTGRVATALKGLEKKGFIIRRTDLSDKRRVNVLITEAGRKLVLEKHQLGIERMVKALQKLDEEEAIEFVRLVKKIID